MRAWVIRQGVEKRHGGFQDQVATCAGYAAAVGDCHRKEQGRKLEYRMLSGPGGRFAGAANAHHLQEISRRDEGARTAVERDERVGTTDPFIPRHGDSAGAPS